MSSKGPRLTEIRVTRSSQARHRSVAGGTVIGDYVDQTTGERVLTVKTVPAVRAQGAQAAKGKPKTIRQVQAGAPQPGTTGAGDGA